MVQEMGQIGAVSGSSFSARRLDGLIEDHFRLIEFAAAEMDPAEG